MVETTNQIVRFGEIQDMVKAYYPDADLDLIRGAYVYSARVHQGQTRMSGEPYLSHPVAVAGILAQMKLDEASVATGLLHDTVEDTLATTDELERFFGSEIANLVDGVTKISKIPFQSKEERQAENFRKMILAMSRDIRVLLVKLADRLHNMRTLQHMPRESQIRISRETMEIYAPLAARLGIYWLRTGGTCLQASGTRKICLHRKATGRLASGTPGLCEHCIVHSSGAYGKGKHQGHNKGAQQRYS